MPPPVSHIRNRRLPPALPYRPQQGYEDALGAGPDRILPLFVPCGGVMKAVFVLNGPNLNLLGTREPATYGVETLADIEARLAKTCATRGISLTFRQSNNEGDLVTWIQEAGKAEIPIILNAGAYTHTSIALHDAIRGAKATCIEVHLSNVHAREDFRHHSYISPVARGVILGFGSMSYDLALQALFSIAEQQKS